MRVAELVPNAIIDRFYDEEKELLCTLLDVQNFIPNETVWEEGADGGALAFILDGKVKLLKATEFSERSIVMGIHHPGSIVGEACFFGDGQCVLTTKAIEKCRIGFLNNEGLKRLKTEAPHAYEVLLQGVLALFSYRLTQAYKRLATIF
jgi:CRP-like cAMP-binding protein